MAFQKVTNTAEINVIYTLNAEPVQNVFYAKFGGAYALANLQALADEVDLAVAANWLALQPVEASYVRTEVRGLTVENDFFASTSASAGPGTDLSATLPNQVTLSIKRASGLTGRSARGRTYWIGIPRDKAQAVDENRITLAYRTLVVAAIEQIRIRIGTVFLWDPVIVSRISGGVKRPEGVTFGWLSSTVVDDIFDTQRDRLPS